MSTRFRVGVAEAFRSLRSAPRRSLLATLAVAGAVATVIALFGVSSSAARSITMELERRDPQPLRVSIVDGEGELVELPDDVESRAMTVVGIESVGLVGPTSQTVTVGTSFEELTSPGFRYPAMTVDAVALDMLDLDFTSGRPFDQGHSDRADGVAVVGAAIAAQLGLQTEQAPMIVIDGVEVPVIGAVESSPSAPDAATAIWLPLEFARTTLSLAAPTDALVRVRSGYEDASAHMLPVIVHPQNPNAVLVRTPPPAGSSEVSTELRSLLSTSAVLAFASAVFGVALALVGSVQQRTAEIGLRYAFGAEGRDIFVQFVAEAVVVGALGGVLGSGAATTLIAICCLVAGWAPTLPFFFIPAAILLGVVAAGVGGIIPARYASRVQPAAALRV